jgi:hypothetical protein
VTEETVGKVTLPGIDDRDHHKPTDIRDQTPKIDHGALDAMRDPLPDE